MQQLSPRKYIETKVRTLPIYKCFVNKDWDETKMADVLVMRRHNNGHVTAGVYLVDLLCLGVKDTFYFFNEPEEEIENRIGPEFRSIFIEIEYNLAHNIVYAGVDFAMDYDIHPHKDFTLTRFILEDDSDDIPIIEIPVGSEDGKPHLIVNNSNQFPDALAKLKHNAGEGNYYYTVGDEFNEDEHTKNNYDEFDEGDDDEQPIKLDDIPLGQVDLINVQRVVIDDLMNLEKIKERNFFEQVIINAESLTRLLPDEVTELVPEEEVKWENIWNDLLDQAEFPNGMNQDIMDEYYESTDELIKGEQEIQDDEVGEEAISNNLVKVLEAHASNPMVVVSIFETSTVMSLNEVAEKAKVYVNQHQQQYPYLQISLALGALFKDTRDLRFSKIYSAQTIKEAFPHVKQFYPFETINFWMCKMWLCLEEENIRDAVQYYYLLADTQLNEWLFEPVLMKYTNSLLKYLRTTQLES